MMWKKYLKLCRPTRGRLVAILVAINITLGIYTIPLLLSYDESFDIPVDDGYNIIKRTLVKSENAPELSVARELRITRDLNGNASLRGVVLDDFEYNPHEFFYIHQPTSGCMDDAPFLMIAVCSASHHFDLRQAIRETWASVIHKHRLSTKLVFMLGATSGEYEHLQHHVTKESQMYGDVIQEDFVDSYVNLTVKSIGVLKWALNFCPGVKYLMKSDDDVFVNIANLISLLMDITTTRSTIPSHFMLGHVIKNAKPLTNRSSKWYAPAALFKDKMYPDYLSGSAYIITGSAIEGLFNAAISRRPFWLEDIYMTGMLSRELDIPLIHNEKFTYSKPKIPHPCFYNSVVSAHEMAPQELHDIWTKLHTQDLDCIGYLQSISNNKNSM